VSSSDSSKPKESQPAEITQLFLSQTLTLWHGIILLALMTGFLIETAFWASQSLEKTTIGIETKELIGEVSGLLGRNLLIAVYMIFGLIGLPVAAHLTVTSGVQIAREFGVS
jgi:Ca2+/Na+ antiporter